MADLFDALMREFVLSRGWIELPYGRSGSTLWRSPGHGGLCSLAEAYRQAQHQATQDGGSPPATEAGPVD